jgi:hypothetical protein
MAREPIEVVDPKFIPAVRAIREELRKPTAFSVEKDSAKRLYVGLRALGWKFTGSGRQSGPVEVLREALEICGLGDVPDYATGVFLHLRMEGWGLEREAGYVIEA